MRSRTTLCLLTLVVSLVGASTPAMAQTAGGSISGTVTTPQGKPLDGVCVETFSTADDSSDYAVTQTASDGSYLLEPPRAGDYLVGFGTCGDPVPGYAPEWYDDEPSLDTAEPLRVEAGQVSTANAQLAPTGSLSGTVVGDEDGMPLPGVCVVVFGERTAGFGEAVTGDDGRYVVSDLPADDYGVYFEDCADPVLHVAEVYDDLPARGDAQIEPTPVAVVSGEDTQGVDAGLALGGAVTGTVVGLHTGQEQPLVCVGLYEAGSSGSGADTVALTGAPNGSGAPAASPGAFTLGGIPAGTYVVAFNPDICFDDGYATTWYDGQPTREQATVLTVTAGEVLPGVDAVVAPQPSLDFACPFDPSQEDAAFTDVPEGNVHRRAIECLALYSIAAGRGDGRYSPAAPVTRAQLASFVARTLEQAEVALPANPPNAFDDDNGDIHERAIDQLAALGVVRGTGERRYSPGQQVTRGQMATFLVNAYEQATSTPLREVADRFTDDEGSVHEANVNKVATAGIAAGTSETTYAPGGVVRRDQMASFLARLLDRAQRDQGSAFSEEEQRVASSGFRTQRVEPSRSSTAPQGPLLPRLLELTDPQRRR